MVTDAVRPRSRLDSFVAVVPVAFAALVILMIMFWEAAVRKSPTIFTDELQWAQLSSAIAHTGHAALPDKTSGFHSLYAYLIAPAWWLGSTHAAYAAIKYLDVVVMSTAAIPIYLLARRLTSPAGAAIAALGTLCTSAFYYATLLLPEVLAYPTFCLCAYACFRALSGGGRRWTVAAIVLCLVAIEVRSELECIGAAFAIAAAWLWIVGPRGSRLRSSWSLVDHLGAGVLLLGALILANGVLSTRSTQWATVTRNYRSRIFDLGFEAGSALTIGLGVLPVIAGLASLWLPERRRDPHWRAFAALLAACIVAFGTYTGVKAAILSTVFGTYVEERNLIYLAPLLICGAVVYFSSRRPSLPLLAATSAIAGWLILSYGYQLGFPYSEAPGYGVAALANRGFRWDQPTIRTALAVTLVVCILAALLPVARLGASRRAALLVLALAVGVWSLAGEVTSARGSEQAANQFDEHMAKPLDWVDRASGGAGVTYLGQQVGDDVGLWLTEFWNGSLKHIWTLDGSAPGPSGTLTPDLLRPDGTLSNDPGLDYVLEDNGVRLIGKVVETNGPLVLVRVAHPWRLSESYYGRTSDGWIGSQTTHDGTFAYFGPITRGTLHLVVSRSGFCAPNAPPTPVVVRIGPVALNEQRAPVVAHATVTRRFSLHSCEQTSIVVPVTPPIAAVVHVANLVRLSDYGISDDRVVGAVIGGSVTAAP